MSEGVQRIVAVDKHVADQEDSGCPAGSIHPAIPGGVVSASQFTAPSKA